KSGNIRNFELAAAGAREGYSGPLFMDSDLYKVVEAASYSLATHPDPQLERRLDEIIAKIAAAQMPDGYLNTYFQVVEPNKRWTNLRDAHELYCAGHLFEAAVAHYQATGKKTLLNVATRFADYIDSVFGDGPGKRMGYPGHPEIELALVKLWRATGEKRYFNLARFFIENRGRKFFAQEHGTPLDQYDGSYWQDNVPIREHNAIVGHAVRAGYLLSGVVDVARETGDEGLLAMVDRVWKNTTQKRMYVTGGIGPSAHNEGFTEDYDLPNLTAYQETCASVAMILWNHRLNLLYGDAKYADIMELALYNGFLAGVSLDGKRFFYVNPLASNGNHHRSEWFGCACCPPNVMRILASLGGYAYAVSPDAVWVNLYIQGSVKTSVAGKDVSLRVTTDYPWDGKVRIEVQEVLTNQQQLIERQNFLDVEPKTRFGIRLRIPGWCHGAKVNGKRLASQKIERGYLVLDREWSRGDVIDLDLPMPVRRVECHPAVKENQGHVALQRGPIVYCLEACDQVAPVHAIAVPPDAELKPERVPNFQEVLANQHGLIERQNFLQEVLANQQQLIERQNFLVVLKGMGAVAPDESWRGKLYRTALPPKRVPITAIPYYAWDNREPGPMKVWIPQIPPQPSVVGPEGEAKVSVSFQSSNCQPWGINDGLEPKSSREQPPALCHWWPHKGTVEWAQYTWEKPITVRGARVYWFDDTGRGECRLPASWHIEYLEGGGWKPVEQASGYPVQLDRWCEVSFAPVTTTALRLVVQMQSGWAAGVHEWQVLAEEE
ncbi:MAG: glycoside hydrolase family 127 protein, partial [Armatimonadota bacterium]